MKKDKDGLPIVDAIPSVLDDPTKRPAIDKAVDEFRDCISKWRLDRYDATSPSISPELQTIMAQGVYDIVESLGRLEHPDAFRRLKATFPPEYKRGLDHKGTNMSTNWADIFTGSVARILEKNIAESQQVQSYAGDQHSATRHLLGSCVRCALDIASAQDISFEGVGWKIFSDSPFKKER